MPDVTIKGTDGADWLRGTSLDEVILADGGADSLKGGDGDDQLYGEEGSDWLEDGSGDDRLFGGDGDDELIDGKGADTLDGGSGDDLLHLGVHSDPVFFGGQGDLAGAAYGGAGDDTFKIDAYAGATVTMEGGSGNDTFVFVELNEFRGAIEIDLSVDGAAFLIGGEAHGTTDGIEALSLRAGDGDDVIVGGSGDDSIEVGSGANTVRAGAGDDDVGFTLGETNLIDGGAGLDHLRIDLISLGGPIDFRGQAQTIVFEGSTLIGFESFDIAGTGFADDIRGGVGDDILSGQDGDDQLRGLDGDDTLSGGSGADRLRGDAGNDLLYGMDDDRLFGGAGADRFQFVQASVAEAARIMDFEAGLDLVKVSSLLIQGLLPTGHVDASRLSFDAAVGGKPQFVLIDQGSDDLLVWDSNGQKGGGLVEIVLIHGESGLTADDLRIV